jgi:carbamate kinase
VYRGWGAEAPVLIGQTTAEELNDLSFAAGSMGPKVSAATRFVERTGRRAAIGALDEIQAIVDGMAGTQVLYGKETS